MCYRFIWERTFLANSEVTIEWEVNEHGDPGTYRIRHFGHAKSFLFGIKSYVGTTNLFEVI